MLLACPGQGRGQFDDYLEAFQKYKAVHGDEPFPSSYVDDDGVKLGQWAARMNRLYFSGKLTELKKERLEEAGFRFHSYTAQWVYDQRSEYRKEGHGNLKGMPSGYTTADGRKLGFTAAEDP